MQIMIGLVAGLLLGWYISTFDDATAAYYANIIRPFSQIFIRMIRMLIAPLLFGTLVAGIAERATSRTSAAWACGPSSTSRS